MADGIGRLSGYGYSVGNGYMSQSQKETTESKDAQTTNASASPEQKTPVDPDTVFEVLSRYNYFVPTTRTTEAGSVDAATADRVASYMEQFEMIYGIIVSEFGEENAPAIMDLVMDRFMGMAA